MRFAASILILIALFAVVSRADEAAGITKEERTQIALNEQSIGNINVAIGEIKTSLAEMNTNLNKAMQRPGWIIMVVVTILSTVCTGLIVYNATRARKTSLSGDG